MDNLVVRLITMVGWMTVVYSLTMASLAYGGVVKEKVTVIFLDIDGVLLGPSGDALAIEKLKETYWESGESFLLRETLDTDKYIKIAVDFFDETAVDLLGLLLKTISEKAGHFAKVVLSSSWRTAFYLKELVTLFRKYELSRYIIGKTPELHLSSSRAQQIDRWLEESESENSKYEVFNFIVIDDVDDCLSKTFGERFILCDGQKLFGQEEYNKALEVALNPYAFLEDAVRKM